jgi:hypothetical protein
MVCHPIDRSNNTIPILKFAFHTRYCEPVQCVYGTTKCTGYIVRLVVVANKKNLLIIKNITSHKMNTESTEHELWVHPIDLGLMIPVGSVYFTGKKRRPN